MTAHGWRGKSADPFTRYDTKGAQPLPIGYGEVAEFRRGSSFGRTMLSGVVWFGVLLAGCLALWVLA
jgi:hypothetical protein